MTDAQPQIRDWMRRVEADLEKLDDKWAKSVDDIKATIKAEVGELKTEQIAELKRRVEAGYTALADYEKRLRANEDAIRDWNTGRGVVNWIIRTAFLAIGAIAAALGYEIFGRH